MPPAPQVRKFFEARSFQCIAVLRSAFLSVSATVPYVGETQAVGQRVTRLLRRKSDSAASYSVSLMGALGVGSEGSFT